MELTMHLEHLSELALGRVRDLLAETSTGGSNPSIPIHSCACFKPSMTKGEWITTSDVALSGEVLA